MVLLVVVGYCVVMFLVQVLHRYQTYEDGCHHYYEKYYAETTQLDWQSLLLRATEQTHEHFFDPLLHLLLPFHRCLSPLYILH